MDNLFEIEKKTMKRKLEPFELILIFSLIIGLIDGININRSDKVNVQLRQFYDSCMDVDSIRTKGYIPGN